MGIKGIRKMGSVHSKLEPWNGKLLKYDDTTSPFLGNLARENKEKLLVERKFNF